MNNNSKINKLILKSAYITIIILIIAVIALIILKYNVEGEKNMPFKLSSIIVISGAEGYQKEENEKYKWDSEIYQNNDIYLNIEKNKNYKETEVIKSIVLENIQIKQKPQVGDIIFYKPSNENTNLFIYEEKYEIENTIEYIGDVSTNLNDLKISNQGGTLIIRAVNKTGKRYTSNEKEFEHTGKLLEKVGVPYKDVQCIISFDLIINLESDLSFKGRVELELPTGDVIKEGSSSMQITDMNNVVFKREQ